ncbi:MAG: SDR family NAD(P)-dependent oxidoreductase [Micromonosporaceae bacterium]|nr:SDR family NAD(P)-dependent oxidoreductase [Micromonosporaceae bacterium]
MTSVVTGAAGFIGRALAQHLVERGEHVIAIDRRPQPPLPAAPVAGRLTVLTADLTSDDAAVRAALADADQVYHLAGCPGVRDRAADVEARRQRDNIDATAAVLAAVPLRTPLVVTSSSSVYGGSAHGRPSAEDQPLRPRGGYARSKAAAERLCLQRLEAGGVVAVARPFTVAGEHQRPDMAISLWLAGARAGLPLRVLGSPDRTRDITDVRHAAQALVDLADRETSGLVNIGTGAGHTLRDLVTAVAHALDTEVRTLVEPAHPAEVTDTLADTRRLRRLVGWAPTTDLPDLIARQAAAAEAPAPLAVPA